MNTKLKSTWPLSAYIAVFLLFILFCIALQFVYAKTKEAYIAVGINNGKILAQQQILSKLQEAGAIKQCSQLKKDARKVEFLSVKTDEIFIAMNQQGSAEFCK